MSDADNRGQIDRRTFLKRAGVATVGATVGAGALGAKAAWSDSKTTKGTAQELNTDGPPAMPERTDPNATLPAVPFHGAWQAGILTAAPPAATFASFDVTVETRKELIDLLKELTSVSRFLATGGVLPDPLGSSAPPPDSGTLGPVVPADGLTVTVGFGSSLFDNRAFGIAKRKPARLKPMAPFPNDSLDPAQTGGDLHVQICAGSKDTAIHAIRLIAKHTRGGMQLNWRLDGFQAPSRPSGSPRNHFGFNDGIANPDVSQQDVSDRLLWAGPGEPAWAAGGTYHVVRIIKMLVEFWDRVSMTEQQTMIGRYRSNGAPLDGTKPSDIPDYAKDPHGNLIPLDAHIRLANPRTAATDENRIFRRGYNYDRGADLNGNLDLGLVFNAFCQDLDRQFIVTQTRLIGEPMVDYIQPVGGGYFFDLPGVVDKNDWYASKLFS
jgi:deferrochelatase/peroxidase EfeB